MATTDTPTSTAPAVPADTAVVDHIAELFAASDWGADLLDEIFQTISRARPNPAAN